MTSNQTVIDQDVCDEMRARASFYRFLSHTLLHEFTADQIDLLRGIGVPDSDNALVREGFAHIKRYLAKAGADPRTDMACDYARVFLSAGVYDGLTAEPYESVFTSDEHILMQDSRDDVVAVYRAQGIDIDRELHMPEDHLGLELEFMAIMADRTADCFENRDDDASGLLAIQSSFIDRHILNWIDALAEKVDAFAKLPFYPAIMQIIKGYVSSDRENLQAIAADVAA
jgi:TorA maturation chaperone TorD